MGKRSITDIEDRLLRMTKTVSDKSHARYNGRLPQDTKRSLYRLMYRAIELKQECDKEPK